jgi:hypothetical protein
VRDGIVSDLQDVGEPRAAYRRRLQAGGMPQVRQVPDHRFGIGDARIAPERRQERRSLEPCDAWDVVEVGSRVGRGKLLQSGRHDQAAASFGTIVK